MEQKVNVWKANLQSGLIIGLIGIMYSLVIYFLDLTMNKNMGYIFMVILVGLLYFFIKSYRDNYLNGYMTYGQSVGAGVILCLYYAVIGALFTYILYSYIDTGLSAKLLANTEEVMRQKGTPESAIGPALEMVKKFQKPWIMALSSLFSVMLFGTIISLLVSIFTKKEGNPLIDTPEEK
jgi:hypothetical protein